jgi:tRNA(Ile)-lysidine synthase
MRLDLGPRTSDLGQRLFRPLLDVAREAVESYVVAYDLPVWHDPMNDDTRFARVRMRRRLAELRTENPRIEEALARLAASSAEWLEVIDALAEPFARLPIDCTALSKQPAAVRKRVLALAIPGIAATHLDRLDRLVIAPPHGTVALDVPGGHLVRCYNTLDRARPLPLAEVRGPRSEVQLRLVLPGDRMRTRAGTRKLSDLFIDRKIPRNLRRTARVRVVDGEIVWAEHLGDCFRPG